MQVHPGIYALPAGMRLAVTIGVFDGMHRGHLRLLAATVDTARRLDAAPAVVTFDPHPDLVLHGTPPPLLCDPGERLALIARAGITHIAVEPFTPELREETADRFVERLRATRRLVALVMTPESAFGRDRQGTPAYLAGLGAVDGFELVVVPQLQVGGEPVSMTRIRLALGAGRLSLVARLLGRTPDVVGTVVHGAGRGAQLGKPTANLALDENVALPPDGVYAVRASWGGADPLDPVRRVAGVASLGQQPTFGGTDRLLEVHLFDFGEDLYGVRLRVEFVRRQRGIRRFASAAALMAQMDRDAARARQLLGARPLASVAP
jgi:riboflavin kinase/FMN adenylyltransferase